MIPTRGILAGLVVLQLTAGLDAFYVCPFRKPSTVSCRSVDVPLARARPRPENPNTAARSSRVGRAHGSALRMAEDTALDIAVDDLEDREFQLEELEDRDVAVTSVVLKKDGSIEAGATNGPLPLSCRGTWTFKDKTFSMEISREFDASIPYTVSRVLTGYVDEVLPATDTVIITGDIVMEEMDVGFFKMISAPSDILDSLERLDKMVERVNVRE